MHRLVAEIFNVMGDIAGCISPRPVSADGAIANAAANRASPLRVQQSLNRVFAISIPQAQSAELPAESGAFVRATASLDIFCLLTTLMTTGPVQRIEDLLRFELSEHLIQHCRGHVLDPQNVAIRRAVSTCSRRRYPLDDAFRLASFIVKVNFKPAAFILVVVIIVLSIE